MKKYYIYIYINIYIYNRITFLYNRNSHTHIHTHTQEQLRRSQKMPDLATGSKQQALQTVRGYAGNRLQLLQLEDIKLLKA